MFFFRGGKLKKTKSQGGEFRRIYFPSKKKGSNITLDSVDGKIVFETEKGKYELSRQWGEDTRASLDAPEGVLRGDENIETSLREALVYGEGVYAELLLSSQRNTDLVFQELLASSDEKGSKGGTKEKIIDTISKAFAESDGISIDAIERAIDKRIYDIEGKHWDDERGAPERAKKDRWLKEVGEILSAYYALEDAEENLKKISQLEEESDIATSDYNKKDEEKQAAEEKYDRFRTYFDKLEVQSERKKIITRIEEEIQKIRKALEEWPVLVKVLEEAKRLKEELSARKDYDQYYSVKELKGELDGLKKTFERMVCPQEEEIAAVSKAEETVRSLENKLCGMNLTADIKMLGNHRLEIKSLRSGEVIETSDITSITEAVSLTIPGIMEMKLAPADVDLESVQCQLGEQKLVIKDIFEKYSVSSRRELNDTKRNFEMKKITIENKSMQLSNRLNGVSFENLEMRVSEITEEPRSEEEIKAEIKGLCSEKDIDRFIISGEATIEKYRDDYGSISELEEKRSTLQNDLTNVRAAVDKLRDIPEEFLKVEDPKSYLEGLENDFRQKQELCEEALQKKSSAVTQLDAYRENNQENPYDAVDKAKRNLEEQKSLLAHWKHIKKIFIEEKNKLANNPMINLSNRFMNYLEMITGGKVTSELTEPNKLDMAIYSSDYLIDYEKLSEGTKETVYLAFRLAMLDHIFPNGGGLAVLDDPFSNMDAERTAKSVEIIKDTAKRHQVILLTCKKEYLNIAGANTITL